MYGVNRVGYMQEALSALRRILSVSGFMLSLSYRGVWCRVFCIIGVYAWCEFIRVYEASARTGVYDGVIYVLGYMEGILRVSRYMV